VERRPITTRLRLGPLKAALDATGPRGADGRGSKAVALDLTRA